jgi:hypothetical protein
LTDVNTGGDVVYWLEGATSERRGKEREMIGRRLSPGARARALLAGAVIALLSLHLGGAAQAAAVVYQPDGKIQQPCHPELADCVPTWLGNNVYNTTASGQKARYVDYPNFFDVVPIVFRIKIQNDGNVIDRYRLTASGTTTGYTVKFFDGTTDITAAVKAGTYRTRRLVPGDRHVIKARVKPNDPHDGDKTTRLVTVTSVANPARQDAVKLVRSFIEVTCGC